MSHERAGLQKRSDQNLEDWLANVAYWNAHPKAPIKINPNDASHKKWIPRWLRIRGYVRQGLKLRPELGSHPVKPNASTKRQHNWQRWALAVSFSSHLRTAAQLRSAYSKAHNYIFLSSKGVAWQVRHVGRTRVGGLLASIEGLLAEAAVYLSKGSPAQAQSLLDQWPATLTKAFASAHNTGTR